ncbi:UNVERIFIED_CONTAM: hypothetical protein FKN15_015497 [Acipenser sinensis]
MGGTVASGTPDSFLANRGNAVSHPEHSGSGEAALLFHTVSRGNTANFPADSGNAVTLPADSGNAVSLPADSGNAVNLPADSGNAVTLPADSGNAVNLPADSENAVNLPADSGNAVTLPADSENALDTTGPQVHPPPLFLMPVPIALSALNTLPPVATGVAAAFAASFGCFFPSSFSGLLPPSSFPGRPCLVVGQAAGPGLPLLHGLHLIPIEGFHEEGVFPGADIQEESVLQACKAPRSSFGF